MPTPANTLKALDPYWSAIQHGAQRAERNLTELQPGGTRITSDEAVAADDAVRRCVNLIRNELIRLHNIVTQYDYPVSGEVPYGVNVRQGAEHWNNQHADPGCTSCGRPDVLIWSPIHKDSKCRWCYDFTYTEGHPPTAVLLDMYHSGVRMTHALVERELRPAREEAKRLAAIKRATRRRTVRKGTAA